ncbi:MAG TPA: cytochrome c, partial [Novosphingobium sp.]|nr:cytochrome c [Novosphingobium sp.]
MRPPLSRIALLATAALFAGVALPGAQTGIAQPSPAREAPDAPLPGAQIFHAKCGICHEARGMGTLMLARRLGPGKGELAKRDDLTADYATAIARGGIMSMPPFTRVDISDAELRQVAT